MKIDIGDPSILFSEMGIYTQNDDFVNLFENSMGEPIDNNLDNKLDNNINKNDDIDEINEELEDMKEGFSSQKKRTEEFDKKLLEAKDIAKKSYKRNKIDNDDDLSYDDYMGKKKKNSFNKYNYFQRKAIFNKMRKGKGKNK